MLWFKESYIPFLLCNVCKLVLFKPMKCKGCHLLAHRACISKYCVKCLDKKAILPNRKPKTVIQLPNILDIKKIITDPSIVYSYLAEKIFTQHLVVNNELQDSITKQTHLGLSCHNCGKNANLIYKKPFCEVCIISIDRNEYCPVCFKTYDPENYEVRMICCDFCLRWVHLECDERVDKHKYDNISDDVDYICPKCRANNSRWQKIRRNMTNDKSLAIYSISLEKGKKLNLIDIKCCYCNEKPANDPLYFMKLVEKRWPARVAHRLCEDYMEKKCVKCKKKNSSIKCFECNEYFHLKCAEGLFRQDGNHPVCNEHFNTKVLLEHKQKKYRMNHRSSQNSASKKTEKFKNINLMSKDIVYTPACFVKILLHKNEISLLKFDGKSFYLDGKLISCGRIKQCFKIDVYKEDIFRIKSKAYLRYRKALIKSKTHEMAFSNLLKMYQGKTKYFFE